MNETVCDHLIESVKWTDPGRLISLTILGVINVLVIVGNCLVIAAVFCSNKLRSVTNYFIVNLAVADLLVGLAVLPFSATWEVYKVWIFGDVWCRIWLAVDVWMCTASILNLCAISLDRYVAVTRPVTYPSIMSTKKAKSLIAGIWVLSFVICFPPLVGWKDSKSATSDVYYSRGNVTLYFATSESPIVLPTPEPCPWKCELTNDRGYVLYSALGSFYIPMFVMLFFYWRIYRAAVRTTRAINQGFKTTKGYKGSSTNPVNETTFTLRIHRGRSKSQKSNIKTDSIMTDSTATGGSVRESPNTRKPLKRTMSGSGVFCKLKQHKDDNSIILSYPLSGTKANEVASSSLTLNEEPTPNTTTASTLLLASKIKKNGSSKRGPKFQVRRFRMETKAAKTLAIIVGGFIICWLPFFSMYLVRAFCPDCIQPLLFSILFWLGYCNSAINPVIYALFSNEFRIAFKRILFRCVCSRSAFRAAENFQMVAARACLVPINFHQTISDCNQHETDEFDWQLLPPSPLKKSSTKAKAKEKAGDLAAPGGTVLGDSAAPGGTAKSPKTGSKGIGNRFDEQRLTLRIHRGRGSSNQHDSLHSNGSTHSTTTTLGTPSPERLSRYATRKHEKIKISVSYPSSDNIHDLSQSNPATNVLYSVHYTSANGRETTASQLFRHSHRDGYLQVTGTGRNDDINKSGNSPGPSKKMGKRNIKAQVKRFRMETKAAKTLAIIVGLFILCWLPFFTMYVVRGFCEECIDPLLFSVLFWLGYCNSAVNPMIYALFSKDFRFAFKRVICRCFCSNQRLSQKTSRRGSEMSQIKHTGARTPSISPSAAAHSLGEESDHGGDMSDSR